MFDPRHASKLIIYGGSFDPPHRAHIELPFEAARTIGADGVLFVPAGQPPHKARQVTPAEHRLRMLELALAGHPRAAIWRGEIDRQGPSFTVDTLRQLRSEFGDRVELRLLMGADMAATFDQWREPREIERLAEPLVMMRPPPPPPPPETDQSVLATMPADFDRGRWGSRIVPMREIDVDSTRLRALLAAGRYDDPYVQAMIPPAVLQYIHEHALYE